MQIRPTITTGAVLAIMLVGSVFQAIGEPSPDVTAVKSRFVRKNRRAPRPSRKAAVVMSKEVGLRSSDERQVCSPLMASMAASTRRPPTTDSKRPPPIASRAELAQLSRMRDTARVHLVHVAWCELVATHCLFD
jgi:hypothetical protein